MKLGHGKSAAWADTIQRVERSHTRPDDLVGLIPALRQATDAYIGQKKNLATSEQRDAALLSLIGGLQKASTRQLAEVACAHVLSPAACARIADEHWQRLLETFTSGQGVEEELSVQRAIVDSSHDAAARFATVVMQQAWTHYNNRNPQAALETLASYVHRSSTKNVTRAQQTAASLLDSWLERHLQRLQPATRVADIPAAAACIEIARRGRSHVRLPWGDWKPDPSRVDLYRRMAQQPPTCGLALALLRHEGPASTTDEAVRADLAECAQAAHHDALLVRLMTHLCERVALSQRAIVAVMRETLALGDRHAVSVVLSMLQAAPDTDATASLQELDAALATQPRRAHFAMLVAPFLLPRVYAYVEGLLDGYPERTRAGTLIACGAQLRAAGKLLVGRQPPWMRPFMLWRPDPQRLQALQRLYDDAPQPARPCVQRILQREGPLFAENFRTDGAELDAIADVLLRAEGPHRALMLHVCAVTGSHASTLSGLWQYDGALATELLTALSPTASPQALRAGARAMATMWHQHPCGPLGARWLETLQDGNLVRHLLDARAYLDIGDVAATVRLVAGSAAPKEPTLHALWDFSPPHLARLQRLARGDGSVAQWASALVTHALQPELAPERIQALGHAFVRSACAALTQQKTDTAALWAKLVPLSEATPEALRDAAVLLQMQTPGVSTQLHVVLDAGPEKRVGWRLACLMDPPTSTLEAAALRRLAQRSNCADELDAPVPHGLRCAFTGQGLLSPVVDAEGYTREASAVMQPPEVDAGRSTPYPDLVLARLIERWQCGDAATWQELLLAEARCPITKQPLEHPVITNDGLTYEKDALEAYLKFETLSFDGSTVLQTGGARPHKSLAAALRAFGKTAAPAQAPWLQTAAEQLNAEVSLLRADLLQLSTSAMDLQAHATSSAALHTLMQTLDMFETRINVSALRALVAPQSVHPNETRAQDLWRETEQRSQAVAFLLSKPSIMWLDLWSEVAGDALLASAFATAAVRANEPTRALQALDIALWHNHNAELSVQRSALANLYGLDEEEEALLGGSDGIVAQAATVWSGVGPLPEILAEEVLAAQAVDVNGLMEMIRHARLHKSLSRSLWLAGVDLGAAAVKSRTAFSASFECSICTNACGPEERAQLDNCTCVDPVCSACTAQAVRSTQATRGIDSCPTLCGAALTRADLERLGMPASEVSTRLGRIVAGHLRALPNWRPCTQPNCDGGCVVADAKSPVFACGLCGTVSGDVEADAQIKRSLLTGLGAYDSAYHANGNGIFRECYHCAAPTLKGDACLHMTCTSCKKDWSFVRGPHNQSAAVINGTQQLYRPLRDGILAKLGLYDGIPMGVLSSHHRGVVAGRARALQTKLRDGISA